VSLTFIFMRLLVHLIVFMCTGVLSQHVFAFATDVMGTDDEADAPPLQERATHGHLLVCYPTREGIHFLLVNMMII